MHKLGVNIRGTKSQHRGQIVMGWVQKNDPFLGATVVVWGYCPRESLEILDSGSCMLVYDILSLDENELCEGEGIC